VQIHGDATVGNLANMADEPELANVPWFVKGNQK